MYTTPGARDAKARSSREEGRAFDGARLPSTRTRSLRRPLTVRRAGDIKRIASVKHRVAVHEELHVGPRWIIRGRPHLLLGVVGDLVNTPHAIRNLAVGNVESTDQITVQLMSSPKAVKSSPFTVSQVTLRTSASSKSPGPPWNTLTVAPGDSVHFAPPNLYAVAERVMSTVTPT